MHPGYAVYNDLALLELKEELQFSESIQPIELYDSEVPANSNVIISGWGLTEHAGANLPIVLQWYTVTALSKTGCATKMGFYTDALICLNHQTGTGACNGDSGGPATYNGKLVGVAGFVVIKCGSSRPDGYAKVAYNIDWIDPSLFTIRAGSTNRLVGGVVRQVIKIIVHENYGDFINDVALLKLDSSLVYSDNIQPIALASSEVPVGSSVVISGWGRLKTGGDSPIKLQWNTLSSISKLKCFTSIFMSSDALICLAHQQDNGACNGDSGGPATFNGELVGVAGFVVGGCGTQNPDGYAKVFYHVDWIKQHSDL